MKREDIKSKIEGITDAQLDWLMDEHGKDINAEKNKSTDLQGKLEAVSAQLKTAQDGLKAFEGVDVSALNGKITELQNKLTAQEEAFRFDSLLDGAIRDGKGRNVKAIRSLLDLDALKASKDQTADIKAALEKCKAENAWAFEGTEADPANKTGMQTGGEHGTGGGASSETLAGEISSILYGTKSE